MSSFGSFGEISVENSYLNNKFKIGREARCSREYTVISEVPWWQLNYQEMISGHFHKICWKISFSAFFWWNFSRNSLLKIFLFNKKPSFRSIGGVHKYKYTVIPYLLLLTLVNNLFIWGRGVNRHVPYNQKSRYSEENYCSVCTIVPYGQISSLVKINNLSCIVPRAVVMIFP